MLLILTSETDLTADYLILELLNRGLPYHRLNTEELASARFTFGVDDLSTHRVVETNSKAFDLDSVTSVWYRRALHPRPPTGLPLSQQSFVAGELRHLALGLAVDPLVTWVNPIDKVSVAELKLYQLRIAVSLGFSVPRTIISGDPMKLREFVSSNKSGTICKPIFHGMFQEGKTTYSIYTRRVTQASFSSEEIELCPVFLQEEIPRICDVRITFIGHRYFVADISGPEHMVDWRDPENSVRYAQSSAPTDVVDKCKAMLQALDLSYGAFDFIRSKSGELVFLELNPTGEWAWLEDQLGFPMRDSFVELFYGDRE